MEVIVEEITKDVRADDKLDDFTRCWINEREHRLQQLSMDLT
jgi:hypothetical protein